MIALLLRNWLKMLKYMLDFEIIRVYLLELTRLHPARANPVYAFLYELYPTENENL